MSNIQDIIPFMKKGWVAMDESGEWWWFRDKPISEGASWQPNFNSDCHCLHELFEVAPADDWIKSLIKIGGE